LWRTISDGWDSTLEQVRRKEQQRLDELTTTPISCPPALLRQRR